MAALERRRHELEQRGRRRGNVSLGDADVGNVIRVTVSYTDGQGHGGERDQRSNGGHGNVNDAPTGFATLVTGDTRKTRC